MCQGIILVLDCNCCRCTKRKEQEEKKKIHLDDANMTDDDMMYRNYCYYASEEVHNHDYHDVSPFLAMELLTQFKYGDGVEMKDEFPVIRISYAYAPTENRATSFLRNAVKKDRMQKIRVLCCGAPGTAGRHPWKGNYHQDEYHYDNEAMMDAGGETNCHLVWKDLTLNAICPFILPSEGGLLDAPSGLRVHEGVLLPLRGGDDGEDCWNAVGQEEVYDKKKKDDCSSCVSSSYLSARQQQHNEEDDSCPAEWLECIPEDFLQQTSGCYGQQCWGQQVKINGHMESKQDEERVLWSIWRWFSLYKVLLLFGVAAVMGSIFIAVISFLTTTSDLRSFFYDDERFHAVNFSSTTAAIKMLLPQLVSSFSIKFHGIYVWCRSSTIDLSFIKQFLESYRFGRY